MASIEIWAADPKVVTLTQKGSTASAFEAGDAVQINTTGNVDLATNAHLHGVARKTCSGTSGTKIPVELIDPNGLYVVDYTSATATAETLIGDILDIGVTTHGAQTWTTGGDQALVVALHPEDGAQTSTSTAYDKHRRLIVRFVSAMIQTVGA